MRRIKNEAGKYEYSVKGDDIFLAIDMVSLAYEDAYDSAILVSEDGDFVPDTESPKAWQKGGECFLQCQQVRLP